MSDKNLLNPVFLEQTIERAEELIIYAKGGLDTFKEVFKGSWNPFKHPLQFNMKMEALKDVINLVIKAVECVHLEKGAILSRIERLIASIKIINKMIRLPWYVKLVSSFILFILVSVTVKTIKKDMTVAILKETFKIANV